NKDATVYTNKRVLEIKNPDTHVDASAKVLNSTIIDPCFIDAGVVIENSVVGPHASIGAKTTISSSVVSNSIIQTNAVITSAVVSNSLIGNFSILKGKALDLSMGDYSTEG
ncbi:MAG: nucleotidyltransferase, partial [Bacteroidota bacterium]